MRTSLPMQKMSQTGDDSIFKCTCKIVQSQWFDQFDFWWLHRFQTGDDSIILLMAAASVIIELQCGAQMRNVRSGHLLPMTYLI